MEDARKDVILDLEVVTPRDTKGVIDQLEQYLPEASLIQNLLKVRTIYDGSFDLLGTKVFYSRQSTMVVVTNLVSKPGFKSIAVFWDKDKEEEDVIIRLLSSLPNTDWHQSVFIYASPLALVEKIENFVINGQLGDGLLSPTKPVKTYMYSMTSLPQDIRLPEGFEIHPVGEEHAKLMLDNWEYNSNENLEAYKRLVKTLPGIGVFTTTKTMIQGASGSRQTHLAVSDSPGGIQANQEVLKESSGGELVSWTQLAILTIFTNTFTLPQYRRLGLGGAATLALAKRAIEDFGIASACIVDSNEISMRFHENLGFTRQCILSFQTMERNIE